MKTGIRLNRANYLSIEAFGFMLMFIWGWCGNCYCGRRATLRIDWSKNFVGLLHIILTGRNLDETSIFIRSWNQWDWNSNHIARRWGQHIVTETGPDWYSYNGALGRHYLV